MNIINLAFKNLMRRKTRSLLTIIGISLSTWVLVSLFGFNRGYEKSLNNDIDNMGFQMLLTAKGCPYEAATLMLKGGTGLRYIQENIVNDVMKYKEVEKVTPMLMHVVFDPNKGESGGLTAYLGVDPLTYPKMKSFIKLRQGKWFENPEAMEVVLGYEIAELEQREVGDSFLIPDKNIELKVVGILERSGTQDDGTIFIPIKLLQKIYNMENKLTGVGIKVNKEANITELENKLYEFSDVQVVTLAQVKSTIMGLVSTAKILVFSIAIIAVLIAMVGVINTVLMSVFERFQELGIFKSMGALPLDVFKIIWTETVILCFFGGVFGSILAFVLQKITEVLIRRLLPFSPTGNIISVEIDIVIISLISVIIIGLLGGLYPAWKAAKIRPVEAIRMEE